MVVTVTVVAGEEVPELDVDELDEDEHPAASAAQASAAATRPARAMDTAAAARAAAGFLLPERSTFATTPVSSPRRRPVRRR